MRQSNAKGAVDALKKALELDSTMGAQMRAYHKLAQAYLATDQEAEAQKALKTLADLRKKAPDTSNASAAPSTSKSVPVPAQLVITASKAILDRVGSGQMSLDEFRRAVTIEQRGVKTHSN